MYKLIILFFLFISDIYAQDITFYEDTKSELDFKQAYAMKDQFKPYNGEKKSLGFVPTTVWIHVQMDNPTDTDLYKSIIFPYPHLDSLNVYHYKDGTLFNAYKTGDMLPFTSRKIDSAKFVVPLLLKKEQSTEMLFQLRSDGALNIAMEIMDEEDFNKKEHSGIMIFGGYYGAVILMLIYNFILFIMIKERVYADYVIFHFFYLLLQMGLSGHAFEYFWPQTPAINLYFIPFVMILAQYFSISFTNSFLEIKEKYFKVYQLFKLLKFSQIIFLLLLFFLPYELTIKLVTGSGLIIASSLFLTGLYVLIVHRTSSAKFFVLAWSFLLTGVLMGEFQNFGILNMSLLSLYGPQIGAFLELGLLSFALAYRYNDIYKALLSKTLQLNQLNLDLEKRVIVRTSEVDEKNQLLLQEVSNKDILLQELFHRVKNNLQIISGLLSLQSNRIQDIKTKNIFDESMQRIKAMALLHEKLYQSEKLDAINMQKYVENLVEDIKQNYYDKNLTVSVVCNKTVLDLERAVPMGLIINELITNALKYAFDNVQKKKITVKMYTDEQSMILEVFDNGKGLGDENITKGFGFKLLKSLAVYQLKGSIHYFDDPGLHYQIKFPKERIE